MVLCFLVMAAGLGALRRSVEEILWEQKSLRVGGGGDDGVRKKKPSVKGIRHKRSRENRKYKKMEEEVEGKIAFASNGQLSKSKDKRGHYNAKAKEYNDMLN
ncbi:hypothetical protein L484_021962 [Morus notabilis]|uniref:Uncharacterized protein n=1 Tax=Morus notabilis TaxID=981085 RepID=W9QMC7_9ROSA|nr:hypothetical protein L484_021962 [Morus notabilis]